MKKSLIVLTALVASASAAMPAVRAMPVSAVPAPAVRAMPAAPRYVGKNANFVIPVRANNIVKNHIDENKPVNFAIPIYGSNIYQQFVRGPQPHNPAHAKMLGKKVGKNVLVFVLK